MDENSDEMSDASNENTFPQRKTQRNGFLKFLREYSSKKYGMDLVEMSIKGGEAWTKLSSEEKEKYENESDESKDEEWDDKSPNEGCGDDDDDDDDCDDTCCPVSKPTPRPAGPCCRPPRRPCCRPKCRPSCCPKPRCCKPRCCKPRCCKPRCCKPKCCRPKPCCKPRRKPCCPSKPCCKPRCNLNCQNGGPITTNGYLNFLRYYRRKHCGTKPRELVMKAARAWCRLSEGKKDIYRRMGKQCFPIKKQSKRCKEQCQDRKN